MIGGIQTPIGGPGRIVEIGEADVQRYKYGFSVLRNVEEMHLFTLWQTDLLQNRKVDFSIFESNVIEYTDKEYKAFEDEAFGPEEEEEEAGAEMLHEEESSESDYELETDTS
ncbi:uncharacterized protein MONOS_3667 [Monocercomonoides exilis]|uniref:uncharacterized protein n=1 Tax=Monocercomonoides exilis TaxID=2049356 RepID=UPI00355A4F14|nr:hypothetical protein MONOS_3667 [Monocercomonoides exilis]|eukprot:MONOS_3667.1-p1 / transcript=MONOS_3667.1 / gene=MONOS_3667 / organism=Monocercomonoides_exilis_PA203 / gene_product=unspecified product / transcript_product=unspecified product / location=Mono_scaffold00088:93758-94490(-) / protein_length=112 / sequence_SO=supercontig / SO=protein_coding / is_pseudo=false